MEAIKKPNEEKQKTSAQTTLPWPPRADAPVITEGYMSCAFPTLFPTGAGDFLAPQEHVVTVGN